MGKTIKLYSKFCVKCIWGEEYEELKQQYGKEGATVEIIRTAYRPKLHEEAANLWGSEDYKAFVYDEELNRTYVWPTQKPNLVKEAVTEEEKEEIAEMSMLEQCKAKPVKSGKKKGGKKKGKATKNED